MDSNDPAYQSVLSIQVAAVFGRGWFYFLTMASVLAALSFSANTAFADFPRMARAIAMKDYMPHVFLLRGRRLLFTHGIYALTGFTALLLIMFRGVTDRLIPLYAIGAFLAFTLSQAGMVRHWIKCKDEKHRRIKMFLNGLGAVATGVTLLVVLVAKFTSGAWITAILVPCIIAVMYGIKRHYTRVTRETADITPIRSTDLEQPLVVIPIARWDKISEKAVRFGLVHEQRSEDRQRAERRRRGFGHIWEPDGDGADPGARPSGPELITVDSTFRTLLSPLMDYILKLEDDNPGRKVAVVLPELVVRRWWENFLHNHRMQLLKLLLLVQGQSAHRCRQYSLVSLALKAACWSSAAYLQKDFAGFAGLQQVHGVVELLERQPVRDHGRKVEVAVAQERFGLKPGLVHLAAIDAVDRGALEDDCVREVEFTGFEGKPSKRSAAAVAEQAETLADGFGVAGHFQQHVDAVAPGGFLHGTSVAGSVGSRRSSAPMRAASSRRCALGSIAKTRVAPQALATAMQNRPMGPQPVTSTVCAGDRARKARCGRRCRMDRRASPTRAGCGDRASTRCWQGCGHSRQRRRQRPHQGF